MRTLKDEFDSLQEAKDVELDRLERELQEANEEIHSLRLDAEEAAALHENEIAGLQEELCRLKAELDRVQLIHSEYNMEITSLRAEINMKEPNPRESQAQPPPEMEVTSLDINRKELSTDPGQPSTDVTVHMQFDEQTATCSEEVTQLQGTSVQL